MSILTYIEAIPEGYSTGLYNHKKYSITKQTFNQGKSFKIYGKELEGTDFVSLNYYRTKKQDHLKPCEMSKKKVVEFLKQVKMI